MADTAPVRSAHWIDPIVHVPVEHEEDLTLVTALRDLYLSLFYADGASELFTKVLPDPVVLAYATAGQALSATGLHPQRVGEVSS